MTIDDIRYQIKSYREKIAQFEEAFLKKELSVNEKIQAYYMDKFDEKVSNFRKRIIKIEEYDTQKHKFGKIRKEEKKALKILNKEITDLSKRKEKELKEKILLLNREKKEAIQNIRKQIRNLLKKLEALEAKKFADKWKKWSDL